MPKQHNNSATSRGSRVGRRGKKARQVALQKKRIIVTSVVATSIALIVALFVTLFARSGQGLQSPITMDSAYPLVDGISCDNGEQAAFHIHCHLTVYINGQRVEIPQYIGIEGNAKSVSCYYWLHTHATDGIIHVEAPANHTFTLANFLNVWSGQFSQLGYPAELDQSSGWQTYVNGKVYSGDFHNIQLQPHLLITLAFNSSGITPDTLYNWGTL
jgi:hypothetical protein